MPDTEILKKKGNHMRVVCIAASNIYKSGAESVSLKICGVISQILKEKGISCEILDLRDYDLSPCVGCGGCFDSRRCCRDTAFNEIYNKIVTADSICFVSPHYAPIPAKLSMLLEKMEEITFLHWWKDNTYQSEVYRLPAGIISHGGGADWALTSYKAMVNDTIANALDTIQCRVVSYDFEWTTGISLPVNSVDEEENIFPIQKYDWEMIRKKIEKYIEIMMQDINS